MGVFTNVSAESIASAGAYSRPTALVVIGDARVHHQLTSSEVDEEIIVHGDRPKRDSDGSDVSEDDLPTDGLDEGTVEASLTPGSATWSNCDSAEAALEVMREGLTELAVVLNRCEARQRSATGPAAVAYLIICAKLKSDYEAAKKLYLAYYDLNKLLCG